jgi:hypothetical protein
VGRHRKYNPITTLGEVSLITASSGDTIICDTADLGILKCVTWSVNQGYAKGWYNGRGVQMQRLLLPESSEVHHINSDGLDNRRCNLRACTHAQNVKHRRPQKNRAGFKGVTLIPHGTYQASLNCDKRDVYLGTFKTAEDAAKAYDSAALHYFKDFARCNYEQ